METIIVLVPFPPVRPTTALFQLDWRSKLSWRLVEPNRTHDNAVSQQSQNRKDLLLCDSYLEVIGACRQELVAHVQSLGGLDPAKIPLTGTDTPGLVANVDKDVVAA